MESLLNYIHLTNRWILQNEDTRHPGVWLANSPVEAAGLLILWIYFVKKLGPKLMENRPAFELKIPIIIYNVVQIIINFWMFCEVLTVIVMLRINVFCNQIDYSTGPWQIRLCQTAYYYYLLKWLDLLETVFFVLRKKQNQVTFLHVYHHVGMIIFIWVGCKWYTGGQGSVVPLLNTFAHFVMYSYYLITSLLTNHKTNVWWKKYITQLQLVQHLLIIASFTYGVLNKQCNYPIAIGIAAGIQVFVIALLFINFYVRAYMKKAKKMK